MITKWRVHRSFKVTAYLIGLREEGVGIRQIIGLLSQYGVPENADRDETTPLPTYTWTAAGYIITCLVSVPDKAIYVAEVRELDAKSESQQ